MTWIKICGVQDLETALFAQSAGANAIGIVLDPDSPRSMSGRDLSWLAEISAERVAVYRQPPISIDSSLFDALQFYPDQPPIDLPSAPLIVGLRTLDPVWVERADRLMFDSTDPGSGILSDWEAARHFVAQSPKPVILAGGLNSENVEEAIRAVRPFGVDVSSGVEISRGVKDLRLIESFISAAQKGYNQAP
ncbi:MAG: phosphoribosylanthranilate isomerase [Armatimonadetes bacterium]|nr:phosphoribosylanthranilate isomerase [Armatimonadota bacterium]